MNPHPSSKAAGDFAARHLAQRPQLSNEQEFPLQLWEGMADAGLLGCFLPTQFGGGGATGAELLTAGEAFVRSGGNLGLATAWFGHLLVARYFLGCFGTADQLEAWMPELAAGRMTASVAISEPGAGAHPKHLTTTAEREAGSYRINGEKFFVTNGNIAGLFTVLAITDSVDGMKRYSAFLVPRETAGLEVEAMPPLDYLRPCQHVRLKLNGCSLPGKNLLGPRDEAFETMARPFRDVEDVLGAGPLLGAMGWQLDALLAELRGGGGSGDAGNAALEAMGELDLRLAGCRVLATEGARLLDETVFSRRDFSGPAMAEAVDTEDISRISMATRTAMREFQHALRNARVICKSGENPPLEAMTHEMSRLVKGTGGVALLKQRKLGARMLEGSR